MLLSAGASEDLDLPTSLRFGEPPASVGLQDAEDGLGVADVERDDRF